MLTSIKDQTVIVTGGSKGIGKGIAKVFADKGAKVMIAARGEKEAAGAVAEITEKGGIAAFACCDVADEKQVSSMVEKTVSTFGQVDILCANAGVFPQKKMVEMSAADWDLVMGVNLKSAFLGSVAKNSDSMLKTFSQTQIPGRMCS